MKSFKKTLVLTVSFSAIAAIAMFTTPDTHGNNTGAPAGKTGSPGDASNCTGCHAGTASTIAGAITSTIPVTGYVPGTTYTVTATISSSTHNEFGFQISPQSGTGVKKGTLVVTNTTNTQLVVGSSGKYITHKAAGTAGAGGTKTWTFNWTAPAAGSGNFTFYGAFVISNNNNANSGDQVRLSTLPVIEDITTGVEEQLLSAANVNVYPNPVADNLSITADIAATANIHIVDITGKLVKTIQNHDLSQNQTIDIADLPRGVYVLKISSEKGDMIKKIIKQ